MKYSNFDQQEEVRLLRSIQSGEKEVQKRQIEIYSSMKEALKSLEL